MYDSIQRILTTSSRRTSQVTRPNENKAIGTRFHALIVAGLRSAFSILARRIAFPLFFLTAGLVLIHPCAGQSGTWTATGSLATARYYHTATLLPNGKVLVAGGGLASAELYDPASGIWTATGSLITGRYRHTATLLPDGKVLVAGGYNGTYLASAELYDPASGIWTATGGLATARDVHTATLLPNGKVLAAGGEGDVVGLPIGTVFTAINNTSATPISGTFSNLADGSTITLGQNSYQVSYSGGDGNDLTLTVQ